MRQSRATVANICVAGLLGFGACVLMIGMSRGETSIGGFFELRKSQEVLEQTITSLEKQNQDLALEIARIQGSNDYARKVLRDKYHITDADENIVFFAE